MVTWVLLETLIRAAVLEMQGPSSPSCPSVLVPCATSVLASWASSCGGARTSPGVTALESLCMEQGLPSLHVCC